MEKLVQDKVFIEGLEIEALIGIYDWERRIRQPLLFDLEMAFDNRVPAASDDIADTLDYKAVSKRLIAFVSGSSFGLVETLAERCAQIVLDEFGVAHVRLKLSKPGAVRGARAVGVAIERSRAPAAVAQRPQPARAPVAVAALLQPPAALPPIAPALPAVPASSLPPPPLPAPAAAAAVPAAPSRTAWPNARTGRSRAYLSLGSNIAPEHNLRDAVAALRKRFGAVQVSPVYRTAAVGFDGPDFLNAIAVLDSDMHPFALNGWLHALEIAQGRDRRDKSYSNRTLDIDIIYFGDLVLEGPGDFQLPRPELHHAFVLKPLADVAPRFVDPIRNTTLAQLWAAHPAHDTPPQRVALHL